MSMQEDLDKARADLASAHAHYMDYKGDDHALIWTEILGLERKLLDLVTAPGGSPYQGG